MPLYTFKNPKTGETKEILQNMDDAHVYTEDGLEWERVFFAPAAAFDSFLSPTDKEGFVRKTATKGMTVGDMWDYSGEMSKKREKIYGKDPVKEKAVKKYERKTKHKHPLA